MVCAVSAKCPSQLKHGWTGRCVDHAVDVSNAHGVPTQGEHAKHSWIALGVVIGTGLLNAFVIFIGRDCESRHLVRPAKQVEAPVHQLFGRQLPSTYT